MCLKTSILLAFCVFFLSFPLFSDTRQEELQIVASMKLDLQSLQLSIQSYKTELADLQNLIKQSQTDSAEQALLLTDCMDKLTNLEKRYSELLTTFNALNAKSRRQTKILKYGSIAAGSIIILEGAIIYFKR